MYTCLALIPFEGSKEVTAFPYTRVNGYISTFRLDYLEKVFYRCQLEFGAIWSHTNNGGISFLHGSPDGSELGPVAVLLASR